MQTFAVSDVTPSAQPLEAVTLERALAKRFSERFVEDGDVQWREAEIEASGANQAHLVPRGPIAAFHPVLDAVHTAFAEHYPLVLSPDDVWLCVAQGFATHVEANAEALRSRFVRHEGKLQLKLERHDFVKGSPDNDWQRCFAEWSDAIAAHLGKKRDLVVASFSTTGPIERAASELVLMSAMQRYVRYSLMTMCGIPAVTLLGTVEDWRAIRHRAEVLAEFDLTAWIAVLLPVLDQLVAAAAGHADRAFWRSIYKMNDSSGGPYVTGWINVLFPYLEELRRGAGGRFERQIQPNPYALRWPHDMGGAFEGATLARLEWDDDDDGDHDMDGAFEGATLGSFPRGLSHVPFVWDYLGTEIPMTLAGGFVGISQDPQTLAVRPAIGWTVREAAQGAGAAAGRP